MKRRTIILADTRNLGKCSCFPRFLVICGDRIYVAHDFNVSLDDQFATAGKVLCADQLPNLLTAPVDVKQKWIDRSDVTEPLADLLNTEDSRRLQWWSRLPSLWLRLRELFFVEIVVTSVPPC